MTHNKTQQGNALFLILIAVALFAALAYAITQSGHGGGSISKETTALQASAMMEYTSFTKQTLDRMRMINNCSEEEVSFTNSTIAGYAHTPAARTACQLFHPEGGGLQYQNARDEWLDSAHTGEAHYGEIAYSVIRIGNGTAVGHLNTNAPDLVMMIPYIKSELCSYVNDIRNTVPNAAEGGPRTRVLFDGSYASPFGEFDNPWWPGSRFDGKVPPASCIRLSNDPDYAADILIYYEALIAR